MNTTKKGTIALTIGALGVVFGDIGTSPLYALQALFGPNGPHIPITQTSVFGIISLVIWSITIVVSIKFIGFIMKADNQGEGGILALVGLIKSSSVRKHYKAFFIILGLIGVSLFYGDSVITPAISILSAVEGIKVVAPSLTALILPLTVVIVASLFWIQKYGTGTIGKLFGPIMMLWFVTIGLAGGWQVVQHPDILYALSPLTALHFFVSQPLIAFIAMSAIVLAITGAEALYADMGHFGRPPIAKAWFFLVFPSLALCYMGQGALILRSPYTGASVFMQLFPVAIRIPIIILATLATLIASQSVISGAFSLTRQAVHLNLFPKMLIRHTSNKEIGQIYLPFINFLLFTTVTLIVIIFGSSTNLANAYGIAVSGTLASDTILFLVVLRGVWRRPTRIMITAALCFLPIDCIFIASNIPKIAHGGLIPLLIGTLIFLLITTWVKGERIVESKRRILEGSLEDLIASIRSAHPAIKRLSGEAVYIGHDPGLAPLALRATMDELHELPEKIVVVSIRTTTAAHVAEKDRAVYDTGLPNHDGITHITLRYGFHDSVNVPRALHIHLKPLVDPEQVVYFISLSKVVLTKRHNLTRWRKSIYSLMDRNALNTSDYYKLPINRTEEMETLIKL